MKNKKIIISLLLLIAIIFSGYKVYSYYWAEGSYSTTLNDENYDGRNIVFVGGSFNPKVSVDGASSETIYLTDGGEFSLSCNEETLICSGSLTVINDGSTSIRVGVSSYNSAVSFSWETTTLSSSESQELIVSLEMKDAVSESESFVSDEPMNASTVVILEGHVSIPVSITATQILN